MIYHDDGSFTDTWGLCSKQQGIIEHILEIHKGVYSMFLNVAGPYVHMVEAADDLGGQQNLLISPKMYCQLIKSAQVELIHEKAPNASLFRHTNGNIFQSIPDLVEAGVNVLNPVQASTESMGAKRLKAAYGDLVTFHGAIEKMGYSKDELFAKAKAKRRSKPWGMGGCVALM